MADVAGTQARERRALSISKWGNLFMGAAGLLAAWLSHSSAILVDGLFSLIGFGAVVIGARVTARLHLAPDRRRPIGYAADEAIYRTFRALSLLGLVAFAVSNAILKIADYATGGDIAPLRFGPLYVYIAVIGAVCFALALTHYSAWRKTGRVSAILEMEAKATTFDGVMTLAAGAGLAILPFLEGGPLGWIAPVGDSIIVIALCGMAVGRYYADFMTGLGELAGVSARPEVVARARRAAKAIVDEFSGKLVDLSVMKLGRSYFVQVYYDPGRPVEAEHVDDLTLKLDAALSGHGDRAVSTVLVSRHGRELVKGED